MFCQYFISVLVVLSLVSCAKVNTLLAAAPIVPATTATPTPSPTPVCPIGYSLIPFNAALETQKDFCVAKFEMKNLASVPTSAPTGLPWVNVDLGTAKTLCQGLGSKYALILNSEWMTIARNLEMVGTNWSSGVAGTGVLARGHSDNLIANALPVSNENNPYSDTGSNATQAANAGWEQKRQMLLSNGNSIWDFSGNVWEWVDWQVTPINKAFVSTAPITSGQGWKEFANLDSKISSTDEMRPATWRANFSNLLGAQGMGRYYAGTNSTGGAAIRSGAFDMTDYAGVYVLTLDLAPSFFRNDVGFRCTYHP